MTDGVGCSLEGKGGRASYHKDVGSKMKDDLDVDPTLVGSSLCNKGSALESSEGVDFSSLSFILCIFLRGTFRELNFFPFSLPFRFDSLSLNASSFKKLDTSAARVGCHALY